MPRPRAPRAALRALPALACLAALGCGLSDYEARIDATQEYLRRYDDENKILEHVIDQPTVEALDKAGKKEYPDVWPFVVMLRVPKGVPRSGEKVAAAGVPLYKFPSADGTTVYVAAGAAVEKTNTKTGALSAEDFRKAAVEGVAAGHYFQQGDKFFPKPPSAAPERVTKQPQPLRQKEELPPPLAFDALTFNGVDNKGTAYQFQLYQHQRGDRQVVVVLQIPAERAAADIAKAVDSSLKTLDISEAAAKKRADAIQMIQKRRDKGGS